MNILYAAGDTSPFVPTGHGKDAAGGFPAALSAQGAAVTAVMPLCDTISADYADQMDKAEPFPVHLASETLYCGLYRLERQGVTWYLIENPAYFCRGDLRSGREDGRVSAFFCKAVCALLRHMDYVPDVIHCSGWQTALIPLFLQEDLRNDPEPKPIRAVLAVPDAEEPAWSLDCQGLKDMGIRPDALFAGGILNPDGSISLLGSAAAFCRAITAAGPSCAADLLARIASEPHPENTSLPAVRVIRSGIARTPGPAENLLVHRPYDADSVEEKLFNKLWMQEMRGLKVDEDAPVFGFVSRQPSRDECDLLADALPAFLEKGCQLAFTGDCSGDVPDPLQNLRAEFPGQVSVCAWSAASAAEIFSSADMLLLPAPGPGSAVLMEALRYGIVPVVRAVGVFRDIVRPCDSGHPDGFGFVFTDAGTQALSDAVTRALKVWLNTETWEMLQRRCMETDVFWDAPASEYLALYESLLQ